MSIKLVLIESVTAGAFDQPLAQGLLPEAEAMLGAMVADALGYHAAAMAGGGTQPASMGAAVSRSQSAHGRCDLTLRVLRRADLPPRWPQLEQAVPDGGWVAAWRAALVWADAIWLVAPETGGELAMLSREIEAAGVRLLGCTADAVAVTASKSATHALLAGRVRQPDDVGPSAGWVLKPDDGVAAEGVQRMTRPSAVAPLAGAPRAHAAEVAASGDTGIPAARSGWLSQPFVAGESLSLCVLSDGRIARVLSVNRQRIEWSVDGAARYCGGVTNAIADRARFVPLAQAVQSAIPGLWGCWGIDCVLPAEGDPVLIEVNPRFTTAFAHLQQAMGFGLLAALLDMAEGGDVPEAPPGQAVTFDLLHGGGAT